MNHLDQIADLKQLLSKQKQKRSLYLYAVILTALSALVVGFIGLIHLQVILLCVCVLIQSQLNTESVKCAHLETGIELIEQLIEFHQNKTPNK